MGLKCGIVGLPNVGKSTLFNALGSAKAEAANYPFCTIEPNVGIVNVPDSDLLKIAEIFKPEAILPAATQFVDIAGLVEGASKGEGLGNKFLSHIREVDAILHLVRCFESEDVVHVSGSLGPKRDIEIIQTELLLSDLQTVEKRYEREKQLTKGGGSKDAVHNVAILERLKSHLDQGNPAGTFDIEDKDKKLMQDLCLLTRKPVLYVANSTDAEKDKIRIDEVKAIATSEGASFVQIDCGLEAEIAQLPVEDRAEFLAGMDLEEPGLNRLIREAFGLLGLMTYYTAGKKEVRAWTIPKGTAAPQAAGEIHSDFEKGFICAEVYNCAQLFQHGSELKLKEAGLMRQEGKAYIVQPGDTMLFRFNVTK